MIITIRIIKLMNGVNSFIISPLLVSISSTVGTTINSLGNLSETGLSILISQTVQMMSGPVPGSSSESDFGGSGKFGVVNEVKTKSLTSSSVVSSTGDLDRSSSLISNTVTSVAVAQILASSFISMSGGEFLHILELSRFVAELSNESVLSGGSGDTSFLHGLVQIRSILSNSVAVSMGQHLLELSNRKSVSRSSRSGSVSNGSRSVDGSMMNGSRSVMDGSRSVDGSVVNGSAGLGSRVGGGRVRGSTTSEGGVSGDEGQSEAGDKEG